MTLIAFTLNYNVPFLLGDLVFTTKDKTEKKITLPTHASDIDERLVDSEAIPVELTQKIYILKPNLCVALAGNKKRMANFLDQLKLRCSYYGDWEITDKIIKTFLNDFGPKEQFKDSAAFFMLLQGTQDGFQDVEIGLPVEYWTKIENEHFELVYACGTGMDDYLKRITIKTSYDGSHIKGDFFHAIHHNIGLFARLLAEEKATSTTTKKRWGAGFETIYFNGESFVKFDNITYVIFQGEYINKDGDIGDLVPVSVMHYKYYGNTLLITSFDIKTGVASKNGDHSITVTKNAVRKDHIVGQLYKDYVDDENIPIDKTFKNNNVAAGFILRNDEGVHTPSFYSAAGGIVIEYHQSSNTMVTSTYIPIIDKVRKMAKDNYKDLTFF